MTMRYFKATDGVQTVFRASATRVYRSAKVRGCVSFSAFMPAGAASNSFPVAEITRAEYDQLVKLKAARMAKLGRPRHATPDDSWVYNYEIACDTHKAAVSEATATPVPDYSPNELLAAYNQGWSDGAHGYPKDGGDWRGDALQAYADGYSDGSRGEL